MKNLIHKALIIFCLILLSACHSSENDIKKPAPLFDNLGKFHHVINTTKPLAQRYFDQGLILLYSFEYGEAIRSFQAAVNIDPDCAMCYWGLALALGSKTDMPLNGQELIDAKNMIDLAMKKVDKQNLSERLYIGALSTRYIDLPPQKLNEFAGLCSSYSAVTGSNVNKYASAMKNITTLLPDDADAKTLYAFSLFDLDQWNFWDAKGKPLAHTLEIINILELAMKMDKDNPGANHLYVHIMEFSPYPKKALRIAKRLSQLVPGSEHLAHMPCHTYFSLGRYHDATLANQRAIQLYKEYSASCKVQGFEPEIQYLYFHNYDFLIASANMEGRKKLSIATANDLTQQIYPFVEKNPALQKTLTNKILTLVFFGEWNTILKTPPPAAKLHYALAIWHYSQGLAFAETHHFNAATQELKYLQKFIKEGPIDANLNNFGFALMQVAENILAGILANHFGHSEQTFMYLNKANELQAKLTSADPPPWYFPTRRLLGEYFLKSDQYAQAKLLFLEDLKKYPENGWSLYRLAQAEHHLGDEVSAKNTERQFNIAWKEADIKVPISLF